MSSSSFVRRRSPRLADAAEPLAREPAAPAWGEYVAHDHLSAKNVGNALLCAVALVPSFAAVGLLYTRCAVDSASYATAAEAACAVAMTYPIVLANALFFVNVTLGFWLVGLAQRSFWLIDPYWTIIPPLLGHLYQLHPKARYDPARSALCLGLLWAWAARLTHSYFRREEWKFGQREDWRYSKMARDMPRLWPLASFFAVGLAQQPMLVGITLPAYTVHLSPGAGAPLGAADAVAGLCCAGGIVLAMVADDQLRAYTLTPRAERPQLLCTGLWKYSRHPNYCGEQLWWWSFAGFAVALGQWYMAAGTLVNSVVLAVVTIMTEQKMLRQWEPPRAALYREYIRTTSPLVPWPVRK